MKQLNKLVSLQNTEIITVKAVIFHKLNFPMKNLKSKKKTYDWTIHENLLS